MVSRLKRHATEAAGFACEPRMIWSSGRLRGFDAGWGHRPRATARLLPVAAAIEGVCQPYIQVVRPTFNPVTAFTGHSDFVEVGGITEQFRLIELKETSQDSYFTAMTTRVKSS